MTYPTQPTQPPYPGQHAWAQPRPNSGLAIASLVLGLVGLVFSWFTFGVPSLLAVIFGIAGIRQTGTGPGKRAGRGMAIAGTILGALILIFGVYVSAVMIWSFNAS